MELLIQVVLLVVGFTMLVKGADWFVDGAAGIAVKFGIPQLVVGLTIVAMGTSAPEAAVSITGAMNGAADIAVGNVLGSNILNVLIILGLTGFITNVAIQKSTLMVEMPFMLAITVIFAIVGLNDGNVGFVSFFGHYSSLILHTFLCLQKKAIRMKKMNQKQDQYGN